MNDSVPPLNNPNSDVDKRTVVLRPNAQMTLLWNDGSGGNGVATQDASSAPTASEMGVDDVVRFLRNSWRWAFAGVVLAGGISSAVILLQPRTWESSANLLVSPPPFSSDIKQLSFNLPSYQRLLESPVVIDETRSRLIKENAIATDRIFTLGVGGDLEAKIFVNKEVVLTPIIECRARGENGEQAQKIVSIWIDVFLKRTKELIDSNSSPSFTLIEEQYKSNQKKLSKLEDDNKSAASGYQRKRGEVEKRWNETISAFTLDSGSQLAAFQNESDRLISDLRLSSDLPGMDARIKALSRALSDLNVGVGADHTNAPRLDQVQSINRAEQVKQIADQLTTLQNKQLSAEVALKKLERGQQVKLEELKSKRALELAKLTTSQKQELDDLLREETQRQAQFTRDFVPLNELVTKLSKDYGQVQITKAQQSSSDIQVASSASLPDRPRPRGAAKTIGMFSFLGLLMGLGVALTRNVLRRIDQKA
jgi:uncharacterized protein involved in exopolysaccharide biosynthesis